MSYSAVAEPGNEAIAACEWAGDESMYPYWAVERITAEDLRRRQVDKPQLRFNMHVKVKEFAVVAVSVVNDRNQNNTHTHHRHPLAHEFGGVAQRGRVVDGEDRSHPTCEQS